jgi:hypothetical protein
MFPKRANSGRDFYCWPAAACSGRGDTIEARAAAPMDSTSISRAVPAAQQQAAAGLKKGFHSQRIKE